MNEQDRAGYLEQRNNDFFGMSVVALAESLQDRVVVDSVSGKKFRLMTLQPWTKDSVGPRYSAIQGMQAGDLYAAPYKQGARETTQALIVASEDGNVGACVRIVKAEGWDEIARRFVPMKTEGSLVKFLGLEPEEKGSLRFTNDSEYLTLIRSPRENASVEPAVSVPDVDVARADARMRKLAEGLS